MHALEDIFKQNIQEIISKKNAVEDAIKRKVQERTGKEQERRQISTDISHQREKFRQLKNSKREKSEEYDALQEQLEELERKRTEILNQIVDLRSQQERIDNDCKGLEEIIRELEGDLKRLENEVSKLDHEIKNLEQKKNNYEDEIREQAVISMNEYYEQLEKRLLKLMEVSPEIEQVKDAYERLAKARNENPKVRALWEAWEEWKSIYEIAQAGAVKETAKIEIERITAEIENQFPGALRIVELKEIEKIIFQLYRCREEDGKYIVFLPISKQTWESIQEGFNGEREELAARVFWSFAGEEPISYDLKYGYPALITYQNPETLGLFIEFPNKKRADFALEEMPDVILEAITYENESQ